MIGLIFFSETEFFILNNTLMPLIGWVILLGINKIDHFVSDRYFSWTFKVEHCKPSLFVSLKAMFIKTLRGNFKGALKDFKNVKRSGYVKFLVAYLVGLAVSKGFILFSESMLTKAP
tara:strand:- start:626 stop:976 length:351 start_codon:yes stop_codon:yes gene_type:complete